MKAAVSARYGSPDVLEIREVPKPQPKTGEVLVKVHATTVSRTDCGMLRARPFFARLVIGLRRPKHTILGMDFAGEVEAVGAGVTSFAPGDRVFGLSPEKFGAHAEYFCVPEHGPIAAMPTGARFEEVLVCEGAWYAETCLRGLRLKRGHRILIYGASGAIGTAALQLAKAYGAEVTAVVATQHLGLVKALGADHAVDYVTDDFVRIGKTFDGVLDAVGKTTYFQCRQLLAPGGIFTATDLGPWGQNVWLSAWSAITRGGRVVFPLPTDPGRLVDALKGLIEARQFRAVIDREYPLEAIAEAYRYVETGQKAAIVVIKVPAPRPA